MCWCVPGAGWRVCTWSARQSLGPQPAVQLSRAVQYDITNPERLVSQARPCGAHHQATQLQHFLILNNEQFSSEKQLRLGKSTKTCKVNMNNKIFEFSRLGEISGCESRPILPGSAARWQSSYPHPLPPVLSEGPAMSIS